LVIIETNLAYYCYFNDFGSPSEPGIVPQNYVIVKNNANCSKLPKRAFQQNILNELCKNWMGTLLRYCPGLQSFGKNCSYCASDKVHLKMQPLNNIWAIVEKVDKNSESNICIDFRPVDYKCFAKDNMLDPAIKNYKFSTNFKIKDTTVNLIGNEKIINGLHDMKRSDPNAPNIYDIRQACDSLILLDSLIIDLQYLDVRINEDFSID
jgi:hypothetical protein